MKKALYRILVLVCLLAVCTLSVSALGANSMNIYGLYLSQEGDATLMESDGKWLLIDTGLESCADELLNKLDAYGVTELDVLISHLHTDHAGGFKALAESQIKIKRLYLPDASLTPYDEYTETKRNRLIQDAQANNPDVVIQDLKVGECFGFGYVNGKVIGPVANVSPDDFTPTEDQTAVEQYVNCRSLTVRFDCGTVSYLTAGDIESAEEQALINTYAGTGVLNTDIMKLSHHALYTSNTEEFMAAVSPRYSFAQNSNKTINEGKDYRMYYNSCTNASKYGPVYLVGDERADFKATVVDGRISIFKGNEELKGLVTLTGGDGTVVKTYKYYITGDIVTEGVYTIDGEKYFISDGGFVNKAFYSHNLEKYVYRYEPVEGGDVRYFDLEGVMYTGFRKINDNYFYFDPETGIMLKGDVDFTPIAIGDKKYAINENGAVYNYGTESGAWKNYDNNYRYFDENGVMQTGWVTVEGKKYYLDPETGLRTIGLTEIDGKKYYFVETNNAGYAWNEGWKEFDGNYRYFDEEGVMKTGWVTVDGKKYYLNKSTGLRTLGLKTISKKTYYFVEKGNAGYAWSSGWKNFDGKYRYFDSDGVMKTGWFTKSDKKYYLDPETGYRLLGLHEIDGERYYFVEANKAAYAWSSGWKNFDGKYRYFGSDGVMKTGWLTKSDKKYYLDPETGYRLLGLHEIDGERYYFVETDNAAYLWTSGWKNFDGNYRYFDKEGVMQTGWFTKSGKKYYLDPETGLRTIGLTEIDGKTYYFVEKSNAGYAWNSGWKAFDDNYRYFDEDGVMQTGWVTVDGTQYYLNKTTGLRETGFVKVDGQYQYVKGGKKSTSTGFVKVDDKYYQIKKGIRVTSAPYVKCDGLYLRLSTTEYTYNGEARKPSIKIYYGNGEAVSSKYYTATYASGRKNVGKYKVTVKLQDKYSGSKSLYFTINPAGTEIDSISAGTGSLKVSIVKRTKQVSGYQLQYSTSKSFSSATLKTISDDQTTTKTLSGLKSEKTYYVRVRTYTSVDGTKYYSDWSDYVAKKTK